MSGILLSHVQAPTLDTNRTTENELFIYLGHHALVFSCPSLVTWPLGEMKPEVHFACECSWALPFHISTNQAPGDLVLCSQQVCSHLSPFLQSWAPGDLTASHLLWPSAENKSGKLPSPCLPCQWEDLDFGVWGGQIPTHLLVYCLFPSVFRWMVKGVTQVASSEKASLRPFPRNWSFFVYLYTYVLCSRSSGKGHLSIKNIFFKIKVTEILLPWITQSFELFILNAN